MPSSYPPTQFVRREVENRPGVTYDADRLTVLYAEDYHAIADELVAIEDALDDVISGGGGGGASPAMNGLPSADGEYSGATVATFAAGYTSTVGQIVYLDVNQKWQLAEYTTEEAFSGMLGLVLEVKDDTEAMKVLLPGGFVKIDAYATLTVGARVYLSDTGGAITQSPTPGTDEAYRVLGWAVDVDTIMFAPTSRYLTLY